MELDITTLLTWSGSEANIPNRIRIHHTDWSDDCTADQSVDCKSTIPSRYISLEFSVFVRCKITTEAMYTSCRVTRPPPPTWAAKVLTFSLSQLGAYLSTSSTMWWYVNCTKPRTWWWTPVVLMAINRYVELSGIHSRPCLHPDAVLISMWRPSGSSSVCGIRIKVLCSIWKCIWLLLA